MRIEVNRATVPECVDGTEQFVDQPVDLIEVRRDPVVDHRRERLGKRPELEAGRCSRLHVRADPRVSRPPRAVLVEAVRERHRGLGACNDTSVVQQREALSHAGHDELGRLFVRCELAERTEARGADAVVVEQRELEDVARRSRVVHLEVGHRHSLHEHRMPVDDDHVAPAPCAPVGRRRCDELPDPTVVEVAQQAAELVMCSTAELEPRATSRAGSLGSSQCVSIIWSRARPTARSRCGSPACESRRRRSTAMRSFAGWSSRSRMVQCARCNASRRASSATGSR